MAPKQIADQSGIMRDGEALPEPTDVATASTGEVGVAVPHSPLPWHAGIDVIATPNGSMCICCRQSGARPEQDHANAEFIVRAVNNHDALLAFAKKQRDTHNCVCRLNAVCGTEVACTVCEANALIASAEANHG
jgi:hypothetical protein